MDFSAQWIWDSGDPAPRNVWLNFRRRFALETVPAPAIIHISADCRYILYINGARVGYGPARSYQFNYQYDTYDISRWLTVGENIIAVQVVHWGIGTFHHLSARGGLLVETDFDRTLGTNRRWRVNRNHAYRQNVPRISIQLPWEEQFDARLAESGWTQAGFDDSQWEYALEIGPVGVEPWTRLSPRRVPLLGDEPIAPVTVTACGIAKRPELVMGFYLQPYVAPGDLSANTHSLDALIATVLKIPQAGTVRLKKCSLYGDPPEILLDGRVLQWIADEPDFYAESNVTAGNHILLLDWDHPSHDMEYTITVAGVAGVQAVSPLAHPENLWAIALNPDALTRAAARSARNMDELLNSDAAWQAIQALDTHTVDAYMETTASVLMEPEHRAMDFPIRVPRLAANLSQHILIDFGREVVGWIDLDLEASEGTVLDFVGFEAIQEGVNAFAFGMNNSFRYTCRAGHQQYQSTVRRGLRYLLVAIHSASAETVLHDLSLHLATYPSKPVGSFRCSDPRLNQIWEISAYTERLCSEDVFSADGAYEQALWVGDAFNQLMVHQVVYGDTTLPDFTFRLIADSLRRTPIVNSQVPSAWENRLIPNWSWLWAMGCREHYTFCADEPFAKDIYPALAQQAAFAESVVLKRKDNLFFFPGAWHFLDWTAIDEASDYIMAHENCLLVASLRATSDMARIVHRSEDATRWDTLADSISAAINTVFWSEMEHAYVDSLHPDGRLSTVVSQPTNVMALFSGVAQGARAEALLPHITTKPAHWVSTGSPFMLYFNLNLLARQNRFAELMHLIRQRWGDMLDRGATTTWETFLGFYPGAGTKWTRSWCHAWAAVPAYFLSRYVLGVIPLEPGYRRVRIAPQPVDLVWASGVIPTVLGPIHVAWERDATGKMHVDYSAPEGCEVKLALAVG